MEMPIDNLAGYLLKHKVKPSYARIKVMEYLTEKKSHPTVDEIYHELIKEIPTLSKTTVYNTLNTFIESGLVRLVTIEDNEARYDMDVSDHGHFKCESCGRIFDFKVDMESFDVKGLELFSVDEKNVYYKGTCSKCLNNNKKIKKQEVIYE